MANPLTVDSALAELEQLEALTAPTDADLRRMHELAAYLEDDFRTAHAELGAALAKLKPDDPAA